MSVTKQLIYFLTITVFSVIAIQFFVSCMYGWRQNLASTTSTEDSSRDNDLESRTVCGDKKGCEIMCERMFPSASALGRCYDLDIDEIQDLQKVFNTFSDKRIRKQYLEEIDDSELKDFLRFSVSSIADLIDGTHAEVNEKPYSVDEAREVLEWIAENDDIADVLEEEDKYYHIMTSLFIRIGNNSVQSICVETTDNYFTWQGSNRLSLQLGSDNNNMVSLGSLYSKNEELSFIKGFVGISGNNTLLFNSSGSFSYLSAIEGSDRAVALAHDTLKQFCQDATDGDLDDKKTMQCIQATYCTMNQVFVDKTNTSTNNSLSGCEGDRDSLNNDQVIEELDDTGDTGHLIIQNCTHHRITDRNALENASF